MFEQHLAKWMAVAILDYLINKTTDAIDQLYHRRTLGGRAGVFFANSATSVGC